MQQQISLTGIEIKDLPKIQLIQKSYRHSSISLLSPKTAAISPLSS